MFDRLAKSTLQQAGLLIGARIGGAAFTLLFSILVTRTLPIEEAGHVLTWISAAMIATVATSFNMEAGAVRYLNDALTHGRPGQGQGFLRFTTWFTATWGMIFAVSLYAGHQYFVGGHPLGIALFCASMPLFGLLRVNRLTGTALGRAPQATIPNQLLRPLVLLIATGTALLLGKPFGFDGIAAVFLVTVALTYALQAALVAPAYAPLKANPEFDNWRKWLATGFFFCPTLLLTEHYPLFLTLAGLPGLGPEDVARLNVVLRLMLVVALFEQGLLQGVTSTLARAYFEKDTTRLNAVLGLYTFVSVVSMVLGLIGMGVLGHHILALFGKGYADAWSTLMIFVAGRALFAATGPSVLLLNVTGSQSYLMLVSLTCVACTAILCPLAGRHAGIIGFAVCASAIQVCWGIALAWQARRVTGVDTSAMQGWRWFIERLAGNRP